MAIQLCLSATRECGPDRCVSANASVYDLLVCVMDPERQPLLVHASDVRCRRYRPLTVEEVLSVRQELSWRRTKFCLVLMFWALMAMFLSIITYILAAHQCTTDIRTLELRPSVPPVHMSFSPLIARISEPVKSEGDVVYAL